MARKWIIAILIGVVLVIVVLAGIAQLNSPRQHCMDAVRQEYMAADKVLQQPIDLNAFCATWSNHPPGI